MSKKFYRALVVDDEEIPRHIITTALSNQAIICSEAKDGNEAYEMLQKQHYDLLVSDLKMPKKNGHSLAVDVLDMPVRPLIAIHTVVSSPIIARDLILRGVEEYVVKPINYMTFAAKMRAMIELKDEGKLSLGNYSYNREVHEAQYAETSAKASDMANYSDIGSNCTNGEEIANNITTLLKQEDANIDDIVEQIKLSDKLESSILELANKGHYNPRGIRIKNVHQLIMHLGLK